MVLIRLSLTSSDEDMPNVVWEEEVTNTLKFDAACQSFLQRAYEAWFKRHKS